MEQEALERDAVPGDFVVCYLGVLGNKAIDAHRYTFAVCHGCTNAKKGPVGRVARTPEAGERCPWGAASYI